MKTLIIIAATLLATILAPNANAQATAYVCDGCLDESQDWTSPLSYTITDVYGVWPFEDTYQTRVDFSTSVTPDSGLCASEILVDGTSVNCITAWECSPYVEIECNFSQTVNGNPTSLGWQNWQFRASGVICGTTVVSDQSHLGTASRNFNIFSGQIYLECGSSCLGSVTVGILAWNMDPPNLYDELTSAGLVTVSGELECTECTLQ